MNIFEKGRYEEVPTLFRKLGLQSLNGLTAFQDAFEMYDTDTTVNTIRDSLVAEYLGYDLLNMGKHGFDAKKSGSEKYLEVKQCSISSSSWGGTWNDTNEEKAKAFMDDRLCTAVALWKGASDLKAIVYGQNMKLGEYLYERMINRPSGSRSTQSVSILRLICEYNFDIICPPPYEKKHVVSLFVNYNRKFAKYVSIDNIKTLQDLS